MKKATTDGQIMQIARRIDAHREKINALIREVENSDHPNARDVADALYGECWFPAYPPHVVLPHLDKPTEWECDTLPSGFNGEPHHKAASKAAEKAAQARNRAAFFGEEGGEA